MRPTSFSSGHSLWYLILWVNFTGPQGAQTFGQTLFWVCLWACYWIRLTFRSKSYSKWGRLPSLMWVGLIRSVKGLNRIKRPSEREHRLRECKCWNIGLFLPWAWTETLALPGSQACQLSDWNSQSTFLVLRILTRELHHQLSWVSSLRNADPETLSFQFLLITLSV